MKRKSKKIIISFLFLLLFFISVFSLIFPLKIFAQDKPLEVVYPEIEGFNPETTQTNIAEYVKYIFNFIIVIVGLIAFGALVFGGIRYLTSAGSPEELNKAKKQIKSAFLGVIILLFSYLILITINPQLIILKIPGLIETPAPDISVLPKDKPSAAFTPLERINEIAQNLKTVAEGIKNYAQSIKSLTDNCDCETTQSMCACQSSGTGIGGIGGGNGMGGGSIGGGGSSNCNSSSGGGGGGGGLGGGGLGGLGGSGGGKYSLDYCGDCEALYCYAAADNQPCPDNQKIKDDQKKIVAFGNEIAYYKNRVEAEAQDLKAELEKIINKKIKWYEERITAENKVLEQTKEETAKDLEREIIRYLQEGKARIEAEKDYKESLRSKLIELANTIEKISKPITTLTALPDQCSANVKEQCSGSCDGGCHDTLGCKPDSCSGGNPCPTDEIQNQVDEINSIIEEVEKIADEIIAIQPKIKEVETPKEEKVCDTPDKLAQQNNEPYPTKRAASLETLLSCIGKETSQPLPSEAGANQYYGSLYTYEHTNDSCNYTRGKEICGNCAHAVNSCHYGGSSGSNGALAADFGNEKNGDKIIQAALKCGAKSARCENSSGQTVDCKNSSADHIHINDKNCDRN